MTHSGTNERLIKNSLFLLVRLTLTLFISLYCSRLVLQELGVVDYGIFSVVGGIVTLLSFLTGAMSSSTQRFLSYEIGSANGNVSKIFSMSLNIYILIVFVTILISQTLGIWFINNKLNIPHDRVEATYWVFQGAVLSFIFAILSAPYNAMILAYERMKLFSVLGVITVLLRFLLILFLTLINGDKLISYSMLMVVVSLIALLLPCLYVRSKFKSANYNLAWDSNLFKVLLGYTGWNLFGNLSAVGFNQGISILINIFFGPTVSAAKGISNQVNAALLGFSSNISAAINPQIIKTYSSDNKKRMIELVFNGSKYSFLFLSFMAVPILVNIEELLHIWLGSVPKYSVEFTVLVIIDSLICGFSGSLMTSIQATGRIKYYQIVIGGILLLNVPLSYYLLLNIDNPIVPFLVTICLSFIALTNSFTFFLCL